MEPNKTRVFFKEQVDIFEKIIIYLFSEFMWYLLCSQNIVIDIIEKYLNNFYGIQRETENNCESSFTSSQDYTQEIDVSNAENEPPACKKRKICVEKNFDKPIEKNINIDESMTNNLNSIAISNSEHKQQAQISIDMQNCSDECAERCEKKTDVLDDLQLPSLDLSDSDSEKSQNFTLIYCDNDISSNSMLVFKVQNKKQKTYVLQ